MEYVLHGIVQNKRSLTVRTVRIPTEAVKTGCYQQPALLLFVHKCKLIVTASRLRQNPPPRYRMVIRRAKETFWCISCGKTVADPQGSREIFGLHMSLINPQPRRCSQTGQMWRMTLIGKTIAKLPKRVASGQYTFWSLTVHISHRHLASTY